MQFQLLTVPLERVVDNFAAVSYCWGSAKRNHSLPLSNGACIAITETVESLLSHICTNDEDLIWIDAVCVNQNDASEKSSQVQIMKDIYRSARRVSVWLGVESKESEVTLKLARYSTAFTNKESESRIDDIEEGFKWFGALLQLPWWVRVWVIQEFCYARRLIFHYGRFIMPESFIAQNFQMISRHNSARFFRYGEKGFSIDGSKFFEKLIGLKNSIDDNDNRTDLDQLYTEFALSTSSEPRDRIFALLNVAKSSEHIRCIIPDYLSETRDVFVHAMGCMLPIKWYPYLLELAGTASKRKTYGTKPLPSWVIDFASGLSSLRPLSTNHQGTSES
jgi:hypothetical protein